VGCEIAIWDWCFWIGIVNAELELELNFGASGEKKRKEEMSRKEGT
jgi:hypothetical protein